MQIIVSTGQFERCYKNVPVNPIPALLVAFIELEWHIKHTYTYPQCDRFYYLDEIQLFCKELNVNVYRRKYVMGKISICLL